MPVGELSQALPRCAEPGHDQRKVVRDGFSGRAPSRRQRYRCINPDDQTDWHRFSLRVPRAHGEGHRCADCAQVVGPDAGPPVASGYRFLARIIADALVKVAAGETYAEASAQARLRLARLGHLPADPAEVSRHGQLVADWVEVFTDVVCPPEDDEAWPAVLLLDGTGFWRRAHGGRQPAFTVLCAYGYDLETVTDPDTGQERTQPVRGRLLAARRAGAESADGWRDLLGSREGRPLLVLTDGHGSFARLGGFWAADDGPPVVWGRCVWHAANNLATALVADLTRLRNHQRSEGVAAADLVPIPAPDVAAATLRADLTDADRLAALSEDLHGQFAGHPAFAEQPASSLAWINSHRALFAAQSRLAAELGTAQSIGPLEAEITALRPKLAQRAQSLRNSERTDRLLRLLTAGARREASGEQWSLAIYEHLAEHGGRPAALRRAVTGQFFR